jgi:hypothetical protein
VRQTSIEIESEVDVARARRRATVHVPIPALTLAAPLVAALVAALLAGCGGSGGRSPSGARGGAAGVTHRALRLALQTAACIRANGVPDYPQPERIDGTIAISFTRSVNPTTPAVQAAAKKCGHRAEQQAGGASSRIVFVHCVRAHGVRKFPYPTASGHVSPAMVRAAGINIRSPAVVRVIANCLPLWLRPARSP